MQYLEMYNMSTRLTRPVLAITALVLLIGLVATSTAVIHLRIQRNSLAKQLVYYTDWRRRASFEGWYTAEFNVRCYQAMSEPRFTSLRQRWEQLRNDWKTFDDDPMQLTDQINRELYHRRDILSKDEFAEGVAPEGELLEKVQHQLDKDLEKAGHGRPELFKGERY
jgi:hypothetical protein